MFILWLQTVLCEKQNSLKYEKKKMVEVLKLSEL